MEIIESQKTWTTALEETLAGLVAVGQAAGTLSGAFGSDTAAFKALAIIQATIATYLGAAKALASVPFPFNFAAAAAVVAAGLVHVGQIASAQFGGSFEGGKKIAGYAAGGSGIVPPGFPNDSFPLMVQSGERVDITPTHKVGGTESALKKLGVGINNLIENGIINQGRQQPIIIQSILDGKIVSESVYFDENRSAENSLQTGDFR